MLLAQGICWTPDVPPPLCIHLTHEAVFRCDAADHVNFEDEEDAEIQRQLEAKQRIAYLKRQVEREQKLREKVEVLDENEDESSNMLPCGRPPVTVSLASHDKHKQNKP